MEKKSAILASNWLAAYYLFLFSTTLFSKDILVNNVVLLEARNIQDESEIFSQRLLLLLRLLHQEKTWPKEKWLTFQLKQFCEEKKIKLLPCKCLALCLGNSIPGNWGDPLPPKRGHQMKKVDTGGSMKAFNYFSGVPRHRRKPKPKTTHIKRRSIHWFSCHKKFTWPITNKEWPT